MYGKGAERFTDIVQVAFEKCGDLQLLYSFGACVGYAIIIADELELCVSHLLQNHVSSSLSFLMSSV